MFDHIVVNNPQEQRLNFNAALSLVINAAISLWNGGCGAWYVKHVVLYGVYLDCNYILAEVICHKI